MPIIVGVRLQQAVRIAGRDSRTSFPSPPSNQCLCKVHRVASTVALALSRPDVVLVFFALLRPLCPSFLFFRALQPRRSSCFSRAFAPPLPGVRFLSRSHAPSPFLFLSRSRAPTLFNFWRPLCCRRARSLALLPRLCSCFFRHFAHPPPTVCFFSRSRAPTPFHFSRPLLPAFVFCRALAPPPTTICSPAPTQFVFLSRSRAPFARHLFSVALSRPLQPPLAFSRALAPRRRSISRAPSSRRLFSFALARPLCPTFVFFRALAPPPPTVCDYFSFFSRSRAPTPFHFSRPLLPAFVFCRALAPPLRTGCSPNHRFFSLAFSRSGAVRVFARYLPTTPATFAFTRTLAPLRPPFAFSSARLCSCCNKTTRLRAHFLLVLVRVLGFRVFKPSACASTSASGACYERVCSSECDFERCYECECDFERHYKHECECECECGREWVRTVQ